MGRDQFAFGDTVRHPTRPEWGVGAVTKVESVQVDGRSAQRVSIRFTGQGVKTLNTGYVELERADDGHERTSTVVDDAPAAALFRTFADDDWLADVNGRRIEEAMRSLPETACDPFAAPTTRLERTLSLYRFGPEGHSLIAWAVAQTGLDDPLSRFNRHELERFFDRWSNERDTHLQRTIAECDLPRSQLDRMLSAAPPAARQSLRRPSARH